MKVLLAGGDGYLGSAMRKCVPTLRGLRVESRDIEQGWDARKDDISGFDACIYLAAVVGVRQCKQDPQAARATNIAGAARIAGYMPTLLASTGGVYGGDGEWVDEDSPLDPRSLYAETKVHAEEIVLAQHGMVARLNHLCGLSPRMRWNEAGNNIAADAARSSSVEIYDSSLYRPWTHVMDAANAMWAILINGQAGETYNVVGENHTKEQFSHLVKACAPGSAFEYIDKGVDVNNCQVSGAKLCRALNFKYLRSISYAISEVVHATRN